MSNRTNTNIHLLTCAGVELECPLLQHFITHYRALGVPAENFHVVLNATDATSPQLVIAQEILALNDIEPEEIWIAPYTSDSMWQKRRDVQRRCVPESDWVISADLDEFHEYPEFLPDFLGYCDKIGVTCVDGVFIDRVALDGTLVEVDSNRSPWDAFPVQAMIQGSVIGQGRHLGWEGTIKLMAFKGSLFPARGGHSLIDYRPGIKYLYGRRLVEFPNISTALFRFLLPTHVHHFKWSATLKTTLEIRLATPGVSVAGVEYARQLLALLDRNNGLPMENVPVRRTHGLLKLRTSWRVHAAALRSIHKARRAGQRGRRLVHALRLN